MLRKVVCVCEKLGRLECGKRAKLKTGPRKSWASLLSQNLGTPGDASGLPVCRLGVLFSGNVPSKCSDEIHGGGENPSAQQKNIIKATLLLIYEAVEDFSIMRHRKKLSARR